MAVQLSTVPYYQTGNDGDIEKREILKNLVNIRVEEESIVDILELTGRYSSTDNKEFFNHTNDWLYATGQVDDATPPTVTAGNTTTLTLDSTANVKANEMGLTKDGKIFYVRSVDDATDLTIEATEDITFADDEVITFPSNAIAEGSSGAEMRVSDMIKRSNQLQIFDTFVSSTDLALGSRLVVDMQGGDFFFLKQQHDAFLKHRMDIANAFLVGKKVSATDGNAKTVYFTRGIDDYIANYGGISETAVNASASAERLDKADFRTFNRSLDQNRAPAEGFLWCGGEMNASIDDLFDQQLAAGAARFDMFGFADPSKKAAALGITSFQIYGRTFHKSMIKQMDSIKTTAASSYQYPDLAYFIPGDKVQDESGNMIDRISGKYLNMPYGVNGRFLEKVTGGLAPGGATKRDNVLEVSYTSWEGLEVLGTEHFGRLKLAAA